MPLKRQLSSKTEIPAGMEAHYVERDGGIYLDVEGDPYRAKVDEMRQTNLAVMKQFDDFKALYAGIDPVAVRQLLAEKTRLEEEQKLKAGQVEQVIETRVRTLKGELDKQLAQLAGERDALVGRLTAVQIDQGVLTAATKRGLRPTAVPDITGRARQVFKLVDGQARAFDGDLVRYGKDGVTPMSLEEWVESQVADAPHLFEGNAGGGAAGNGSGGVGGVGSGKNPFRKGAEWNLTEQGRLFKTDPGLAKRLQAAALGS